MPKNLSEATVPPPVPTKERTDENTRHTHNTDLACESESGDVDQRRRQDGSGELALSESTVPPPTTHDRPEWTEGETYDGEETQAETNKGQEPSEYKGKAKDEQRQNQRRRSREHDNSLGRQRRQNESGELALTESTVTPPVTQDRQDWTEGDTISAWLHDEQARAEGMNMGRDAEEEEEEREAEDEEQEEEEELKAQPDEESRRLSKHATHLYSVSYLVFFSIWGTLARLGLQSLTFYTGAPVVTGVLWANVAGCIVMGFVLEDRSMFKEEWGDGPLVLPTSSDEKHERHERIKKHKSVKKTIPLYIGLTTGFCGCLTSFSSFIRDIFLALSDDLSYPPPSGNSHHKNGGYSVMAIIAVIATEVALSMSALIFGAHLALGVTDFVPTIPFKLTRKFIDRVCIFLGWGCWLGSIFLAIWPPDRHGGWSNETWRGRAIFAVVFAPLGCLFRFYISMHLNTYLPTFPLGTFTANVFGTMILGMCFDLEHVRGIGAAGGTSVLTSCQVLEGVMDGFCGSATTVSTWVAELNGLGRRCWAYLYGFLSIAVSLGFLVVIVGSLRWTIGFSTPTC